MTAWTAVVPIYYDVEDVVEKLSWHPENQPSSCWVELHTLDAGGEAEAEDGPALK